MTTPDQSSPVAASFRVGRKQARFAFMAACGLCLSLLGSGVGSLVRAQDRGAAAPYALIFGTVWNAENLAQAGVRISIRRADEKNVRWRLVSDRRGEFAQRVPAGRAEYVIRAEVQTPKGQNPPEVHVQIENDERVNVSVRLTE